MNTFTLIFINQIRRIGQVTAPGFVAVAEALMARSFYTKQGATSSAAIIVLIRFTIDQMLIN